jgi:transcriptional regulator with PAS, ATPase and Fis domain
MQTHVIAPQQSLELASVELVVIDGPDRGKKLVVAEATAVVGTAPSAQLRLTDPTVSRLHCEVQLRSEGVRLIDTASTNGTFVDGVRVRDAYLSSGSTLRLGGTALRAQLGTEPFRLPLSARDRFGPLLGGSVEMRRVYAILERVAPTETTVLIQGETGTGKEVVARAIHDASARAKAPFVAVDCGAIADNLIESELFGHVRGAFSGAMSDREGLFEEADHGTLFLDEIGELPLPLQPKLLRALEGRQVRRVGSNSMRPIDVRVVAATNRPLAQAVNLGTFREDLYYRLAVVDLALPPLRARREDIPGLAQHFLERFAGTSQLPPDLLATLLSRSWPGNVRELRNYIEQRVSVGLTSDPASVRQPPRVALPPALEALVPSDLPLKDAREAWMESFERSYVRTLLKKSGGNITRAAELAGVNRRFLYRLMERLGMGPSEEPPSDD